MVKRYTIEMDFQGGSPGLEDEAGEFIYAHDETDNLGRPGYGKHWQVVLASDYDALAAESEARHQSCLVLMKSVQDHRDRIRELEAALRNLYNERNDQDTVEHAEAVEEAERLLTIAPTQPETKVEQAQEWRDAYASPRTACKCVELYGALSATCWDFKGCAQRSGGSEQ